MISFEILPIGNGEQKGHFSSSESGTSLQLCRLPRHISKEPQLRLKIPQNEKHFDARISAFLELMID
jgi:hypothetical protein